MTSDKVQIKWQSDKVTSDKVQTKWQSRYSFFYKSEIKMDAIEARAVIKCLIKGKEEESPKKKFTREWQKCMAVHAHHHTLPKIVPKHLQQFCFKSSGKK